MIICACQNYSVFQTSGLDFPTSSSPEGFRDWKRQRRKRNQKSDL